MADTKISEISTETPAFVDIVTGLQSGDNANFTLQSIYDLFQSVIADVDPLPSGTYAKVMYYDGTNWGASNEFVTDGTAVTIGQSTPDATAQLAVRDTGGTPKNYTTASVNSNGSNLHTKHGMSFFTQNGAADNINQASNEGIYRAVFGDGATIFKGDVLLDTSTSSDIRFGTFDVTTGNFSEGAKITSNGANNTKIETLGSFDIYSNSSIIATFLDISNKKYIRFGGSSNGHYFTFDDVQADHVDKAVFNCTDVYTGTDYRGAGYNTGFIIGNGGFSDTDMCLLRVQKESTTVGSSSTAILEILNNGNIITRNLPTSSAGLPTGALWNNSGVLNIA